MNKKPQPKCEVIISWIQQNNPGGKICFNASANTADEFSEFGELEYRATWYFLTVDARYDFAEVVEYIKNYG